MVLTHKTTHKTTRKTAKSINTNSEDTIIRDINLENDYQKLENTEDNKNENINKYGKTFVIGESLKNPDLRYDRLKYHLQQYGLVESNNPNVNHMFGILNYKFYDTKFYLVNNFQFIESFKDKFSLHSNLKRYFPIHYNKTYPKSFMLSYDTKYNTIKDKLYIARPIEGEGGKDITIINSPELLEKAKEYIPKYSNGISLTEYVQNPMLYKGKKMHLRCYFMITLIDNVFNSYLLDGGGIYTANLPYKNSDFTNKGIHDTHFSSSGGAYFFPEGLYNNTQPKISNYNDFMKVYNNLCDCLIYVSKIAVSSIQQYQNAQNTYEIYGIDVMVRDDFTVFIIEINARYVGYAGFSDYKPINDKYFDWIDKVVLQPCIGKKNVQQISGPTTPIYTAKLVQ